MEHEREAANNTERMRLGIGIELDPVTDRPWILAAKDIRERAPHLVDPGASRSNESGEGGLRDPAMAANRDAFGRIELPTPVLNPIALHRLPDENRPFVARLLGIETHELEKWAVRSNDSQPGRFDFSMISRNNPVFSNAQDGRTGAEAIRDSLLEIEASRDDALASAVREYDGTDHGHGSMRAQVEERNNENKPSRALLRQEQLARERIEALRDLVANRDLKPSNLVMECLPVVPMHLRRRFSSVAKGSTHEHNLDALYREVLRVCDDYSNQSITPAELPRMLGRAVGGVIDGVGSDDEGRRGRRAMIGILGLHGTKHGALSRSIEGVPLPMNIRGSAMPADPAQLAPNRVSIPGDEAVKLTTIWTVPAMMRTYAINRTEARRELMQRTPRARAMVETACSMYPGLWNRPPTVHVNSVVAYKDQPRWTSRDDCAILMHPASHEGLNLDHDGDAVRAAMVIFEEGAFEAGYTSGLAQSLFKSGTGQPLGLPSQSAFSGLAWLAHQCQDRGEDPMAAIKAIAAGDDPAIATQLQCIPEHGAGEEKWGAAKLHHALDEVARALGRGNEPGSREQGQALTAISRLWAKGFEVSREEVGASMTLDSLEEISERARARMEQIQTSNMRSAFNLVTTSVSPAMSDADRAEWARRAARRQGEAEKLVKDLLDTEHDLSDEARRTLTFVATGGRTNWAQLAAMCVSAGAPTDIHGNLPVGAYIDSPLLEPMHPEHRQQALVGGQAAEVANKATLAKAGFHGSVFCNAMTSESITVEDCGIDPKRIAPSRIAAVHEGLVLAEPVTVGEHRIEAGEALSAKDCETLAEEAVKARVRSAAVCDATSGVCAQCRGAERSMGKLAPVGMNVGIRSATALSELVVQDMLRSFKMDSRIRPGSEPAKGYASYFQLNEVLEHQLKENGEIYEAAAAVKGPEREFAIAEGVLKLYHRHGFADIDPIHTRSFAHAITGDKEPVLSYYAAAQRASPQHQAVLTKDATSLGAMYTNPGLGRWVSPIERLAEKGALEGPAAHRLAHLDDVAGLKVLAESDPKHLVEIDCEGNNALFWARSEEAVQVLREAGASAVDTNQDAVRPLDAALVRPMPGNTEGKSLANRRKVVAAMGRGCGLAPEDPAESFLANTRERPQQADRGYDR